MTLVCDGLGSTCLSELLVWVTETESLAAAPPLPSVVPRSLFLQSSLGWVSGPQQALCKAPALLQINDDGSTVFGRCSSRLWRLCTLVLVIFSWAWMCCTGWRKKLLGRAFWAPGGFALHCWPGQGWMRGTGCTKPSGAWCAAFRGARPFWTCTKLLAVGVHWWHKQSPICWQQGGLYFKCL